MFNSNSKIMSDINSESDDDFDLGAELIAEGIEIDEGIENIDDVLDEFDQLQDQDQVQVQEQIQDLVHITNEEEDEEAEYEYGDGDDEEPEEEVLHIHEINVQKSIEDEYNHIFVRMNEDGDMNAFSRDLLQNRLKMINYLLGSKDIPEEIQNDINLFEGTRFVNKLTKSQQDHLKNQFEQIINKVTNYITQLETQQEQLLVVSGKKRRETAKKLAIKRNLDISSNPIPINFMEKFNKEFERFKDLDTLVSKDNLHKFIDSLTGPLIMSYDKDVRPYVSVIVDEFRSEILNLT
ncbi:MAG: hypothetical protein RLZZ546_407, partial [Bacteroidota bacterium]